MRQKPIAVVVEDDENALAAISAVLENEGFLVHSANCAVSAWGLLEGLVQSQKAEWIRVIVSDLLMSNGDGASLLARVRKSPLAQTPFVITSGGPSQKTLDHLITLGADGLVHKPFGKDALLSAVRAAIQRRTIRKKPFSTPDTH